MLAFVVAGLAFVILAIGETLTPPPQLTETPADIWPQAMWKENPQNVWEAIDDAHMKLRALESPMLDPNCMDICEENPEYSVFS